MASFQLPGACTPDAFTSSKLVSGPEATLLHGLGLGCALVALTGFAWQRLVHRRRFSVPQRAGDLSRIIGLVLTCSALGTAGIAVRSMMWLAISQDDALLPSSSSRQVWLECVCILSSLWIQFFLLGAQMWWMLFYSVEVYCQVQELNKVRMIPFYHMLSWGMSAFFCVPGVVILTQSPFQSYNHDPDVAIPQYISTYLPLLLVALIDMILLSLSILSVSAMLKRRCGVYTADERCLRKRIKMYFQKIMITFSVCWMPNLLAEALLFLIDADLGWNFTFTKSLYTATVVTWVLMVVLNPMYAFLQSLAFYQWNGCGFGPCQPWWWNQMSSFTPTCEEHVAEITEENELESTMQILFKFHTYDCDEIKPLNLQLKSSVSETDSAYQDTQPAHWLVTMCCKRSAPGMAESKCTADRGRRWMVLRA
ncbi:G-protein coupled receptor 143-like [Erpetoichthys calabaricus]|uniref:G-protein coupled receptor 143-like n=1 Tax=Erpetoichthys calabaricus TaxID=27687 RepID=A0A8C4SLD4_ERPCA|nr:G-protein coupled receptor 143-like [Erpetoichthys calabaricus]